MKSRDAEYFYALCACNYALYMLWKQADSDRPILESLNSFREALAVELVRLVPEQIPRRIG